MYIVADISKGKILTGLIYMLQKYALKVKTFKPKFELLIFSSGCIFIHSPLFENKKRPHLLVKPWYAHMRAKIINYSDIFSSDNYNK